MPKVTIDVPERFEDGVEHLEKALQRAQKGVDGAMRLTFALHAAVLRFLLGTVGQPPARGPHKAAGC
jgi:hypothetical protein